MKPKTDRTMVYIAISVVLLIAAIAGTSLINSRAATGTDIRARASVQSGLEYEGTIMSLDYQNRTLTLDSLKPINTGMALTGIWTAAVPSDLSIDGLSEGMRVKIIVDSKSFSIQQKTMGVKKIESK